MKNQSKPKTRNWVQQMHIEQNRKAGSHKDKTKYSRKEKHKVRYEKNHN